MRTEAARWLAVVILAPLLALGTFGGMRVYAHAHDDHGMHFHAAETEAAAVGAAAMHRANHHHGTCAIETSSRAACDSAGGHESEHRSVATGLRDRPTGEGMPSEGILIVLPDQDQLPALGIDLNRALSRVSGVVLSAHLVPTWPTLDRHIGSPGGGTAAPDRHVLHATDRLIRGSRALIL